jgi:tryptophan synthase alpha chain
MNRIEKKFKALKRKHKKAFIAFITAGYPSLAITEKLILEFDRLGVDIVELGVPFSDPLADGAIIQEACAHALKNKTHLIDILNLVKKVRKRTDMPLCLMTYYNPIFCFGEEKFASCAKEAGVDGVIIPDLPPEEGKFLLKCAKMSGLDTICFLSPTSSKERMQYITKAATGFIYYVSLTGVTGARERLPADLAGNLKAIKKYTDKPICVGFGVSNTAQIKQIYKIAEGVIVGSAIVKKIKDNLGKPDLVKRVSKSLRSLMV